MIAVQKTKAEPGVTYVDIPVPEPKDDEVLIKVKAAAYCKSDLDVVEWTPLVAAANYALPFTLGHEFAGEVVKVGKSVKGFAIGDRVAAETHIPCGYCQACRTGNQHICGNHMGVLGRTVNGCFAEYISMSAGSVLKIADTLTYEQGSLMEPFATAMHAVTKAAPYGQPIAILGVGTIGQMAVEIAKCMGATQIFAVDISDQKLEETKARGADFVINGMKEDFTEVVLRETGGVGVYSVIDFTGSPRVINQAVRSLRIAGTLVHVGMVNGTLGYDNFMYDVVYRELNITGIYGRRMFETWELVNNLLGQNKINMESFIGKRMKLSELESASKIFNDVSGRIVFSIE